MLFKSSALSKLSVTRFPPEDSVDTPTQSFLKLLIYFQNVLDVLLESLSNSWVTVGISDFFSYLILDFMI